MDEPKLKVCPGCKEAKPILEAFRKDAGRYDKADSYCKKCRRGQTLANRPRENARWSKRRLELAKVGKTPSDKPKEAINARSMALRHFPENQSCRLPRCANRAERHHFRGAVKEHALDIEWLCRKHHAEQHVLEKCRKRLKPSWL